MKQQDLRIQESIKKHRYDRRPRSLLGAIAKNIDDAWDD